MGNEGDHATHDQVTHGVSVEPGALAHEAAAIRSTITTLLVDGGGCVGLMPEGGLGSPVLTEAFGAFLRAWSAAIADLTDDVARLADTLDLAAQWYDLTEADVTAVMAGRGGQR